MINGLLQGSFEILHGDHMRTFEYCKQYCDNLTIALNTNSTLQTYKGRMPICNRGDKKVLLEGIRYVDEVIEGYDVPPKQMLIDNDIDVFFVGDEFVDKHKETIEWMEKEGKKVIVCPRWGNISTSEIKKKLLEEYLKN